MDRVGRLRVLGRVIGVDLAKVGREVVSGLRRGEGPWARVVEVLGLGGGGDDCGGGGASATNCRRLRRWRLRRRGGGNGGPAAAVEG